MYIYIYLYVYKKLSPKWKKFKEQKVFLFQFYILCENFSKIEPIIPIRKFQNFEAIPLRVVPLLPPSSWFATLGSGGQGDTPVGIFLYPVPFVSVSHSVPAVTSPFPLGGGGELSYIEQRYMQL